MEQIPTDLMTTTTTTVSETTAAEAVGLSAAAAAVPPAPGVDQKKWAGRRRPALKTSKCDVRTETTSKIGQLAEEKKNYIQEKLKMRQAEHRLRMEVLELKRKFYSKHVETPEP